MNQDASVELQLDPEVEAYIDAFEEGMLQRDGSESDTIDLEDFLPDRSNPLFPRVATELIRVDLELAWKSGTPKLLADYDGLLQELGEHDGLRSEAAFEEYRQRVYHGERVTPAAVSSKYNVSAASWTTFVEQADVRTRVAAESLFEAVPQPGDVWREFEILREIGRGALSRVLLAKQTSLSGRKVVLKFSPRHNFEAEKLSRLQHQNIVPVFSVYETDHCHVFCMPFLGDRTLADDQQDQWSETRALELMARLSDAVCHAHQRDILHNDIKPANVLWDGEQPMLLDFNLAADIDQTDARQVGGTLPYMSPEALQGILEQRPRTDQRSDLYAMGAMIFQLLHPRGEPPFPNTTEIKAALRDRTGLPRLEQLKISPGFRSMLATCLAPCPGDRYQSSEQLLEDLHRHRNDLPLVHASNPSFVERVRKWCRRHPKMTSFTTVAGLIAVLLVIGWLAWAARGKYVAKLEAQRAVVEFQKEANELMPSLMGLRLDVVDADETVERASALVRRYTPRDSNRSSTFFANLTQRDREHVHQLREKLGFMTVAAMTDIHLGDATSDKGGLNEANDLLELSRLQQGKITTAQRMLAMKLKVLSGDSQPSQELNESLRELPFDSPNDRHLVGWLNFLSRDYDSAIHNLETAVEQDPEDFTKWFSLANAHIKLLQWQEAEHCLSTCLARQKNALVAVYVRALVRRELGDLEGAVQDYDAYLAVSPDDPGVLLDRAVTLKNTGDLEAALVDVNKAVGLGLNSTRPLMIRSRIRAELGDRLGSAADRKLALAASPENDLDWVSRGVAQMASRPDQAAGDFEKALELNPICKSALTNIAYLLSEKLAKPKQALGYLDQLVDAYPAEPTAYGGRGVLLARQQRFDQAIDDAEKILTLKRDALPMLQGACIYAMASKEDTTHVKKAMVFLGQALKLDPRLGKIAKGDPDLKQIRHIDRFNELCKAAQLMAGLPEAVPDVDRKKMRE